MISARRTGALALLTLLAALVAPPGASARDGAVTSADGTKIALSFFPAIGAKAGERLPTVLVGHGYGQSRETTGTSDSEMLFGQIGTGPLRRAGFNVLTWDARGFGQSGGKVMVDGPETEGRDVQALIDFVAHQPEALLDAPGDPRLGMAGASYAGGIQLVSAAIDRRIDAIAPDIAWHSLVSSLYKDATFKDGWNNVLYSAGEQSSFSQGLVPGPAGVQMGDQDPHITSAFASAKATGKISAEDEAFFASRGPGELVQRIRVPTLLTEGTADTLFTLREAIANYDVLRRNRIPVKMIWFCGGHGVCLTKPNPPGLLERATLQWFSRWLKRDGRVDTGAGFQWVTQDGALHSAPRWPLPAAPSVSAVGSGSLALSPGMTSGAAIAASPAAPGDAIEVPFAAPRAPAQLLGSPALSLTYSGTAQPADARIYAQLVDSAANLALGNQVTPIPVVLDGKAHTVVRPLEAIAISAPAGGTYKLQLVAGSSVYDRQRAAGRIDVMRAHLTVPVADTRAQPAKPGARRRCTPGRGRLTFALTGRHGRVVRADVYVNHRRVRTLRGRSLRRVAIARPRARHYRVQIVARTVGGTRVTSIRKYRGCRVALRVTKVRR